MKFTKLLLVLSIFSFTCSGCVVQSDPGTGQKIGNVVRVSKQGILFKTWEVEIIRGGISDGSGSFGSSFHCTIENHNSKLVDIAIEAMENNQEVMVTYEIEFVSAISRSENAQPRFVRNIEFIGKRKTKKEK